MSKIKILVADDSKTVRTMLDAILRGAGFEVMLAADGSEAVELARNCRPCLAILDIVMPEMDGYAVCEQLQQMGSPWREMPIVFLTSVKSQALRVLGSEYGAYMNKPVNSVMLLDTIREQLARRVPQPAPGRVPTSCPVDDSPGHDTLSNPC